VLPAGPPENRDIGIGYFFHGLGANTVAVKGSDFISPAPPFFLYYFFL